MIAGVNHVTLSVSDPAASYQFYVDLLGCRPVARWPRGAYLLAGELWLALVLDDTVRDGPLPEYTHVAFSVAADAFAAARERLLAAGVTPWQDNWSEGDSLYFLDPDGHKLEIHAGDLQTRLAYAREHPWEGLELL